MNKVFIADIQTILPPLYDSEDIVDRVYCQKANSIPQEMAMKIVRKINIKYRPLIIDPDHLPDKKLLREEDSGLNWGVRLVERLTEVIPPANVGFFGLAYNVSSVGNSLPNLSAQILAQSKLLPEVLPEEKISYGCASGIFVIQRAAEYCRSHNKAAIVYIFDQCSWAANIVMDRKHPDFKNSFTNSLIFGDGGAGLLLIPSSMRSAFPGILMEIKEIIHAFEPTNTMHLNDTGIQLNEQVHKIIPPLAVSRVIMPLLKHNKSGIEDVPEWSFHQGGIPILREFSEKSVLGLSAEMLAPSQTLYQRYGNLSSASMFFVLDHHFRSNAEAGRKGIAVSFGSGFYLGGILYEKQ